MLSIKEIMKKDFSKLSSSDSMESAFELIEKSGVDCLLIEEEEEGEIKGLVTSRELVGYPSSRLILDCPIEPIGTIPEEASQDEAFKILEREKVNFLVVLNEERMPTGVINQEIIVNSLFQELKKAYQELSDMHVQLVQAGKLTAMGEMAAGVAHELTQPLLGIKGFATALLEDARRMLNVDFGMRNESNAELKSAIRNPQSEFPPRAVNDLEVILQQTDRMTTIVNMVRDFAHAAGTEMVLLDINKPLEDALMLFSEQLRLHNIVLEKNFAQGLPQVMGNANQLQQVLINLITNARDAMDVKGGKGQLKISTRKSTEGIYIEIEDTGIGADAETVSRMFLPFFTTKTEGKGTGLGLSIVDRIIMEHGGRIDVQCALGEGCKFTFLLPSGADMGGETARGRDGEGAKRG